MKKNLSYKDRRAAYLYLCDQIVNEKTSYFTECYFLCDEGKDDPYALKVSLGDNSYSCKYCNKRGFMTDLAIQSDTFEFSRRINRLLYALLVLTVILLAIIIFCILKYLLG